MNNSQTVPKKIKHFQRPSYGDRTAKLNTRNNVDNSIPKITGLKDNLNYNLWINNINYDTTPPTLSSDPASSLQFSFDVFDSLRTDFPNYNTGDNCDPSYQGNGNTSYLLLDFFVGDTHQNAAKIIIQGDKITTAVGSVGIIDSSKTVTPYVFNFLSTKNSLFHILQGLKPRNGAEIYEKMKNISIVITPYDNNDYAGFPLTIMCDKLGNSWVFNQYDIDAFHTVNLPEDISISEFELGSYVTNFFVVPNYETINRNIDISGFCNNNDYGVNFSFKTISNDIQSNFIFSLFPYSNIPGLYSDFPVCFKDKENKHLNTMYANDPSIKLISEISLHANPVTPKQNYFKLVNLPNTLILKKNNMGIDSLMKLNTQFLENVVIIPKTTSKSTSTTFLLKKNRYVKK